SFGESGLNFESVACGLSCLAGGMSDPPAGRPARDLPVPSHPATAMPSEIKAMTVRHGRTGSWVDIRTISRWDASSRRTDRLANRGNSQPWELDVRSPLGIGQDPLAVLFYPDRGGRARPYWMMSVSVGNRRERRKRRELSTLGMQTRSGTEGREGNEG